MVMQRKIRNLVVKAWMPVMASVLFFALHCTVHAQALTPVPLYVASAPSGNDANSCMTSASPCLTISGAVSKIASLNLNSGVVQIQLLDTGPFSGLYLTNTLTGAAGYNTSTYSPDYTETLSIVANTITPAIITQALGASGTPLGANFICSAGAQLSLSNLMIEIADDTSGIEAISGCQIYIEGPMTFVNAFPVSKGAQSAMYQQYNSSITVWSGTNLKFGGLFQTVLNGEGIGEIDFTSTGGAGTNAVTCAPGTQISIAFADAELNSAIQFESGWNWDGPSGCGPSGGRVTATGSNSFQVQVATGAVVSNGSGFNLPGPCNTTIQKNGCVKVHDGGSLTPSNAPTINVGGGTGGCPSGALLPGATNYAGNSST